MEANSGSAPKRSRLTKGFEDELDLLTRHVQMLRFVQKHGPIGIIRLSQLLEEPKHKVRYSLRILQREGYIRPSTQGAAATEKVAGFIESVRELLKGVTRDIEKLQSDIAKEPE